MTQTNNSQPGPIYVFTVNLQTQQFGSWGQPNSSTPITTSDGGSYVEVNDQKFHRTIWLPGASPGTSYSRQEPHGGQGTVTNAAGKTATVPATSLADGYYRHGDTVVAYGVQGLYLKNMYVSNPAKAGDVLVLVSVT